MARTHRTIRPKIPSKTRSNSKRLHSAILQRKAVNTAQETKRNAEKKSNSHTQCFSSSNQFFRENLHWSNQPIPRHIQPRIQIYHGRLQPRFQHNPCRTHEEPQWPRAPKNLHGNPQPPLQMRAITKNAIPWQRVPKSLTIIHDC